jgi:hypothetical protein
MSWAYFITTTVASLTEHHPSASNSIIFKPILVLIMEANPFRDDYVKAQTVSLTWLRSIPKVDLICVGSVQRFAIIIPRKHTTLSDSESFIQR